MSGEIVWLASYPRSGNTYLRTVLYQCFGLRSASIYPNDLLGQRGIESLAGHIEHDAQGRIHFGEQQVRPVKTHALPGDGQKAIYVLRDGREAAKSLYHFWREKQSLASIVEGQNYFGTWAEHVEAWRPRQRPRTLLLRYEDLVEDLSGCVVRISGFLGVDPLKWTLRPRDELAEEDGRWIKPVDTPKIPLEGPLLHRFWEVNGQIMQEFGYW